LVAALRYDSSPESVRRNLWIEIKEARVDVIDLAPNHKLGLTVSSPLLLSPTAAGFGDLLPRGVEAAKLGAVVVGPVSAAGRGYAGPATLVEIDGGVLVQESGFSRSARRAVERYDALWVRLGCPVIVQLVDAEPADLARSARHLLRAGSVAGVEWCTPALATPALVADGVRTLAQVLDAPIWVKLPLQNTAALAERAAVSGAAGLVIGQPLPGATVQIVPGQPDGVSAVISGALYGPATFPVTVRVLHEVATLSLGCALIACGGVHTSAHVQQALAAGAHAVQLDTLLWSEPGLQP
jgi:dihydroorotate dehydrogenase (NAD+) catalytic subunit